MEQSFSSHSAPKSYNFCFLKAMQEKPRAYEAYQKLADDYARMIETKPHNAYYERPATLALLPDVNGKTVLDAGCGPGIYAEELIRRGAKVVCVDASDRMIELARNRLGPGVEIHQVDLSLPLSMFGDGQFDLVLAPLSLDYIADWLAVFREFLRVLRPGGYFVMSAGHPSFDAEYYSTEKYFEVEAVECLWKGFGIEVVMPSFRRSLQEFINCVLESGFVLDRVCEPLPTEAFRRADPERFRKLMHRPGFLLLRARKPE